MEVSSDMKVLGLTIAFVLELIAFAYFAGIAFTLNTGSYIQIILAIILLIILIAFWSLYMAPKATKKLRAPSYFSFKFCIYSISAYSVLRLTGEPYFYVFIIVVVL